MRRRGIGLAELLEQLRLLLRPLPMPVSEMANSMKLLPLLTLRAASLTSPALVNLHALLRRTARMPIDCCPVHQIPMTGSTQVVSTVGHPRHSGSSCAFLVALRAIWTHRRSKGSLLDAGRGVSQPQAASAA
jgi:hypothetical protein